jgi:hypothetical protein
MWAMERGAADPADAFSDIVGGGKDLFALLVEEKVIIAEMGTRHMPMEILRFQIKSKHIGGQNVQRGRNLLHRVRFKIGSSGRGAARNVFASRTFVICCSCP